VSGARRGGLRGRTATFAILRRQRTLLAMSAQRRLQPAGERKYQSFIDGLANKSNDQMQPFAITSSPCRPSFADAGVALRQLLPV
jgi:hypothetical protein